MSQIASNRPALASGSAISSERIEPVYPTPKPHPETRPWYCGGAICGRKEL